MKHYHCPVNSWDCPYYKNEQNGDFCICGMDGNPYYECEDFRAEWDGYRENDYTDDHD